MPKYKNGKVPSSVLVKRGKVSLSRGTWAKWDRLVSDVKARFGVTLVITQGSGVTSGSGGYRSYAMQVAVKAKYIALGKSGMAATPGTSSHGGAFVGKDALAIDVNNYTRLKQSDFFAAVSRAGFEAGYFDGGKGRPNEPWHIIDWDPWRSVVPPKPDPTPVPETEEEEDDMPKNSGALYRTEQNVQTLKIFNTESGFETHITSSPGGSIAAEVRTARAALYDIPSIQEVSWQEADVIAASLAEVRAGRGGTAV